MATPLRDMELEPLPEGWEPVGVVAMIKCLDEDGDETWAFRTSEQLTDEETLGALVIRTELSKKYLLKSYSLTDDEE